MSFFLEVFIDMGVAMNIGGSCATVFCFESVQSSWRVRNVFPLSCSICDQSSMERSCLEK